MSTDRWSSAVDLADALRRRETTARAVCEAALERISRADRLHAFQLVDADRALARADALDRLASPAGRLHGVPVAIKDNIAVRGMTTTAGSRALEQYVPLFDATVVRRLEEAGAVVVGKTICDEFAMGSSTENCAFGPSKNPWDLERVPGGSSGGSAVAVAAGLTPVALGSDTGGSIRQPAALCGVVGLKPTYGRVSRYGLIAFASSLDQVGPIGRSVEDVALALEVASGIDPLDPTSAPEPVAHWTASIRQSLEGLRIGVPTDVVASGVDPEVRRAFDDAVDALGRLGVRVSEIALPHSDAGIPVYYIIATAEASSNLARYDGVRYGLRAEADGLEGLYELSRRTGFGAEVKRRIMLGTYVLSAGYQDAYYRKAQQVRTLIRQDFDRAFASVDAVVLPTAPTPAFRLHERTADPIAMYRADVFTVGAPLAGLPALSVPCGFATGTLPVGLQIIGRAWDESTILRIGRAYEAATTWHDRHPPEPRLK